MTILPDFLARRVREAEERADRVHEAVIGIVVDNKDPKKLGRVKVRFPTLPGQDTSWWAPIAAPGAGKDRGWFFLPEIDDEVLVMFEHGEIRRPVVIGALWNGVDAPPERNGGGNERRVFVSREGSRIVLDDDAGTVTVEDGGGAGKIVLASGKITLEAAQGDVCVQAPQGDLNVAAREIAIEATQNLHIQTGSNLTLGTGGSATVRATRITISASSLNVNQGSGASAVEASADCADVPDPVGGG